MASKKQLAANRRNAQKSTGPKTDEGKAIVASNPLKHGARATDKVILSAKVLKEDISEYETLLHSLQYELNPTTRFQEFLVRKIANCLWRSERIAQAETSQVNQQLDELVDWDDSDEDDNDDVILEEGEELESDEEYYGRMIGTNKIGRNTIPAGDSARSLMHYEMRLDRQLTRTYALLKTLQLVEEARTTPIPFESGNTID